MGWSLAVALTDSVCSNATNNRWWFDCAMANCHNDHELGSNLKFLQRQRGENKKREQKWKKLKNYIRQKPESLQF